MTRVALGTLPALMLNPFIRFVSSTVKEMFFAVVTAEPSTQVSQKQQAASRQRCSFRGVCPGKEPTPRRGNTLGPKLRCSLHAEGALVAKSRFHSFRRVENGIDACSQGAAPATCVGCPGTAHGSLGHLVLWIGDILCGVAVDNRDRYKLVDADGKSMAQMPGRSRDTLVYASFRYWTASLKATSRVPGQGSGSSGTALINAVGESSAPSGFLLWPFRRVWLTILQPWAKYVCCTTCMPGGSRVIVSAYNTPERTGNGREHHTKSV